MTDIAPDSPVITDAVPQASPSPAEPVAAPEIFIDGYLSQTVVGGMVKIAFFSHRYNVESGQPEMRVVLRTVASLAVMVGIHQSLGALLADVEAKIAGAGRAN